MATEKLGLEEINLSQASKEVSHNTALRQIEGRMIGALSKTTASPPGSPAAGDVYIIPVGATGEWLAKDRQIAHRYGGVWNYWMPTCPVRLWITDTQVLAIFDGTDWVTLSAPALALPVADTQTLVKGSADATKLLRFEVDGFTTATTRVATVPNKNFTIAGLDDLTGGTVTSVAFTAPAEFSVAGSPITSSGTIAVTKANQSANQVYAGPTSGGAAAPAFRALVAADMVYRNLVMEAIVFGFTTDVTTGDGAGYMVVPSPMNGLNLVRVHARVITAGTTGTTDIQIHNVTQAADMLSTKITIDSGETGSDTAATPPVINTAEDDVATNDLLRVDVDAVSTTKPKGLLITLEFA